MQYCNNLSPIRKAQRSRCVRVKHRVSRKSLLSKVINYKRERIAINVKRKERYDRKQLLRRKVNSST